MILLVSNSMEPQYFILFRSRLNAFAFLTLREEESTLEWKFFSPLCDILFLNYSTPRCMGCKFCEYVRQIANSIALIEANHGNAPIF